MPNCSLTAEPFGVWVMNSKVWTKNILYSHFLLKSEAVILTCWVHHQKISKHSEIKYAVQQLRWRFTSDFWRILQEDLLAFQVCEFTSFRTKAKENSFDFLVIRLLCSGGCSLIPETVTISPYYLLLSLEIPPNTIPHCR